MTRSPYTEDFYRAQADDSERSARRMIPELLNLISPTSVVDVGCGVGTWLRVFEAHGIHDFLGIDGSYVNSASLRVDAKHFAPCDLSKPTILARSFDLVLSMEVAEHLAPERASGFVADLCRLAPVVLFSAAIPGQRGTNHVNEQWQSYWASLFDSQGFIGVEAFGRRFWFDNEVLTAYQQNTVLYAHSAELLRQPKLHALSQIPSNRVLDIVHPHYWANIGLHHIITAVPNALSMAMRKRLPRLVFHRGSA